MKKVINIVWNILQVIIVIYVILIVSFMFFSNKYGYSEIGKYVLDADNNYLLIIKKSKDIKIGDYIYYYSVVDEKYKIVSDNVTTIDDKLYNTNNNKNINKTMIIGKATKKIGGIGFILNKMDDKFSFLFFVLIPIFIVFVYQVYKFISGNVYLKEKSGL
ncbi:MAG: hypothetical protein IJ097_01595 [Bacilli bacterium]|nr:hypothetical protein [Bacilli bacterium]